MPRRWLSVRGQKESEDVVTVIQDHFDFEFVSSASLLTPAKSPARMFSSSPFRSRKPKNDHNTPSSPFGSKAVVDKRLQLTKVEDNWIGIAFGSPTHPPTSMPGLCDNDNGILTEQPYHTDASVAPITSSFAKYKKLGNLFRSRSGPVSISSPTNVYKIDGDQKIGMPVIRKPLPNSRVLPDWLTAENPECVASSSDTKETISQPEQPSQLTKPLPAFLPKLEIQIPNAGLDRYSVMFSNVSGVQPSSLLERRSRNLTTTNPMQVIETEIPPIPALGEVDFQRPTTPTHRRKSSTYSLFPSPPKSQGSVTSSLERQVPQRQLSYSSRPSTATDVSAKTFDKDTKNWTPPHRYQSASSVSSPDDTVASSERNDSPWRSTESLHSLPSSRTSIGSEIYFDLKPAVDLDGRQKSEYVIHRPDPPAVELAVSKSRSRRAKNRSQEENLTEGRISPDMQAAEHVSTGADRWRLSLELNQAIAEVERLTSPLSSTSSPIDPSKTNTRLPEIRPQELLSAIKSRRRLDGLAIGIPSPITERSEEFSLCPSTLEPVRMPPRQHIASLSIRPAPLNISDDSLIMVKDFLITPPPVPIKDAKYIPISKFVAKDSSVKLIEHHPKQHKSKRIVADPTIVTTRSSSATRYARKERRRPAVTAITTVRNDRKSKSPKPRNLIGLDANVASLLPAAEISVARTVSLQRKQSNRILLSSPKPQVAERMNNNITLSPGRCLSPTVYEGRKAHQPGASFDLVVETSSR